MFKNILVPIDVAHKSSWETAIPQAIEPARPAKARIAIVTIVRDTAALLEGVWSRLQLQAMADAARGQKGGRESRDESPESLMPSASEPSQDPGTFG